MELQALVETFKKLGFDGKETQIYLALLKRGETTVSKLAEETRIERTLIYYIIEKLIDRGLVSLKFKNNVKYYSAANPGKIAEDLKEKEEAFQKILPYLEKINKQSFEEDVRVDVYKELPGFKAVMNDMFKQSKEFLVLGEQGQIQKNYPIVYQQYLKRLKESGTKEKVIVREDLRGKIWKSKNSEFKYISKDLISPITILICDNKIQLTIWEKPMFNILITSKKVADSFKSYFHYFWKIAEK